MFVMLAQIVGKTQANLLEELL